MPQGLGSSAGLPTPGRLGTVGGPGGSLRAQSRSSPHERGHIPSRAGGELSRVSAETLDRALGGTDGAGRRVGLEQDALPLCCLERRTLRGLGQSRSPPAPGCARGAEGLHGAWGWAEGCLEVTWIGPSSGGIVLEELGLSSGLGSLCLVYLFIQKGLELSQA